MKRRHFEAIAAALKASKPETIRPGQAITHDITLRQGEIRAWRAVAIAVRDAVDRFNENFDAERFDLVAGIAESE